MKFENKKLEIFHILNVCVYNGYFIYQNKKVHQQNTLESHVEADNNRRMNAEIHKLFLHIS